MRSCISLTLFAFFFFVTFSCSTSKQVASTIPLENKNKFPKYKLAIIISVDQMRYDYLLRFQGFFNQGLKSLISEGIIYSNAYHDYGITESGPGHATISTGCYPSKHGIVENDYYNPDTQSEEYCVAAPEAKLIGSKKNEGRSASPKSLKAGTVGDWLKEANPKSKVYSVALKDRASILMSGKKANKAFWFDNATTEFIFSDYYDSEYPAWADSISGKRLLKEEIKAGWDKIYTEDVYWASREDNFPIEGGAFSPVFPHDKNTMNPIIKDKWKNSFMLGYTPLGDKYTLDFAKLIIENEDLGKDKYPDILNISLSAASRIGHQFGPLSQEIQDYYLRLDEYMCDFFCFLDDSIGVDNYFLVFTSGNGVMPVPEELARRGYNSKRISPLVFEKSVKRIENQIKKEFSLNDTLIVHIGRSGISLKYTETRKKNIPDSLVRKKFAKNLELLHYIDAAYTIDEIQNPSIQRPYLDAYRNSTFPGRGDDIKLRVKKYFIIYGKNVATIHSSPYEYDTHVPLIFFGKNFKNKIIDRRTSVVDIAPTIAKLLGNTIPEGIDGKILTAVTSVH